MRSTSGYLEVVGRSYYLLMEITFRTHTQFNLPLIPIYRSEVPPTIIESQSSQVADVTEHANVSIQCKANGYPRANISWRRDDGLPIRLNGRFNQSNGQTGQSAVVKLDSVQQTSASRKYSQA